MRDAASCKQTWAHTKAKKKLPAQKKNAIRVLATDCASPVMVSYMLLARCHGVKDAAVNGRV